MILFQSEKSKLAGINRINLREINFVENYFLLQKFEFCRFFLDIFFQALVDQKSRIVPIGNIIVTIKIFFCFDVIK